MELISETQVSETLLSASYECDPGVRNTGSELSLEGCEPLPNASDLAAGRFPLSENDPVLRIQGEDLLNILAGDLAREVSGVSDTVEPAAILGSVRAPSADISDRNAPINSSSPMDDNEFLRSYSYKEFVKVNYSEWNLRIARKNYVDQAKQMASDLYAIELRNWQAGIPWDLNRGRDVMCVVGTDQGKTMIAVCYASMFPSDYILFISPLVALMESQVDKFASQGISAICLSSGYIDKHPDIWTDIKDGKYQVVICAPEVVSSRNGTFWRRIASQPTKFKLNCKLIIIDEAHLIWGWQTFREDFCSLGTLRANFPRTAICAMSATMPPHIRSFVHKTLHLQHPTILCKETINRPNICYVVAPMLNGANPLEELAPFIKETEGAEGIIPTIIYMDDRQDCKELAVRHRLLLKDASRRENALQVIRPFSSACSSEYQAHTLELMHSGVCKVIYATASASNGIDFTGIRHIVQYGLNATTMDFCSFIQRSGRSGRCLDAPCIAVLFAQMRFILPRLPSGDSELETAFAKYRKPVQRPSSVTMRDLYKHPFTKSQKHNQGTAPRTTVQRLGDLDPMLLWFINTTGCRRQLLLEYFTDPFNPNAPEDSRYVCCDVCHRDKEGTVSGISLAFSLSKYFALKALGGKRKEPHKEITNQSHKDTAAKRIRVWRDSLWSDRGRFPISEFAPPSALVTDANIHKIASRAARVKSPADVREIIGDQGWLSSILKDHVPELVQLLVDLQAEIARENMASKANSKKATIHPSTGIADIPDRTWMISDPLKREEARAERFRSIARLQALEDQMHADRTNREEQVRLNAEAARLQKQLAKCKADEIHEAEELCQRRTKVKAMSQAIEAFRARLALPADPTLPELNHDTIATPQTAINTENIDTENVLEPKKPPVKQRRTRKKADVKKPDDKNPWGKRRAPEQTPRPPLSDITGNIA